jgi:formylglycine-generating enzyme required for sulfatase activity
VTATEDPGPEDQVKPTVDEAALARAKECAQLIALGQNAEAAGDLAMAVEEYHKALEIEQDAELSAHAGELERRMQLARALAHADGLAAKAKYDSAVTSYGSALAFAKGAEKESIRASIQRMKTMASYEAAMRVARGAHERRAWDETIVAACKALEIVEGDAEAARLLEDARRELDNDRHYESAMTEARRALAASAWMDAASGAETALRVRPGDEAARQVLAAARDAQARQKAADEARLSNLLDASRAAARLGDWKAVRDHSREALALDPESATATSLLEESEWHLNLPAGETVAALDMRMVLVPGGEFLMGSNEGDADEKPAHRVRLDPFYIGACEVTNAQYEKFDPTHAERRTQFSPRDDMPAVGVSWNDAVAFCGWLSGREGVQYRLPTEAEWERAARGTDGATYPWGSLEPTAEGKLLNAAWGDARASWAEDGAKYAAAVGSYEDGTSPEGVYDMAGNVWEWCMDWYATGIYADSPPENPQGPREGGYRVFRGGSFANAASSARASNRSGAEPALREASLGFRCVRPVFRPKRGGAEVSP